MQQAGAEVMVGPLSGDEAVAVANWAKARPTKTVIIGTAGSQDPTLQIAPKNVFRYHGDGAQWNAGIGEIVYKKLGWRKAAIIMDDYSFGWTSGAGIIADFCAIGGQITKRVFPPLNTTDYSSYVRQLPPPGQVDGYFWVVGGTGTGPALKAFEQAYGTIKPTQHSGNLFLWFLTGFQDVAPRLVGSYVGGFGTAPGLKSKAVNSYHAFAKKTYPGFTDANFDDGFLYNYYQATKALVAGLNASAGATGAKLQQALPTTLSAPFNISNRGNVKLDSNRQAIQDQWPVQIVQGANGPTVTLTGYVPNVDQSFGGLFKKSSPPPGRTQPPCVKKKLPWQGKIRAVKNGVVTNSVIK
jgi:branched-chain amino acid transport system substrate-binding protein